MTTYLEYVHREQLKELKRTLGGLEDYILKSLTERDLELPLRELREIYVGREHYSVKRYLDEMHNIIVDWKLHVDKDVTVPAFFDAAKSYLKEEPKDYRGPIGMA